MKRRMVLTATGIILSTSLGGCLSTIHDNFDSSSVERKEYPSHPNEFTNDSVSAFVEDHEGTEQYNEHITDNTAKLNIGCRTAIDVRRDNKYYTITRCMGSDTIEERGSTIVGEIGTVPIFHEITPDKVHRAELSSDSPVTESTGTGLRIVNFAQKKRLIDITITELDNSDGESIFKEDFSLAAESYHEQRFVVDETDTYHLTIKLDNDTVEQYEWNVTTLDSRVGVNIYLTSEGHIEFGTLDEPY